MVLVKRALAFVMVVCLLVGAPLAAQPPAPVPAPQQQDEFVPLDELPPEEQMPAAPLLVAAYAFLMLALFGYVASVARRISAVRRDIERLEADMKRQPPA